MGSKKSVNSTRARKRAVPKSTEDQAARTFKTAEAVHLVLVGVRSAAAIAARAGDQDMEIHLTRNVLAPLNALIAGWERRK